LNASAPSYNVSLDDCGGHTHDAYGYHYHAQVLNLTSNFSSGGYSAGQYYTAYIPGPYKCKSE
jgi:hypothetical protein